MLAEEISINYGNKIKDYADIATELKIHHLLGKDHNDLSYAHYSLLYLKKDTFEHPEETARHLEMLERISENHGNHLVKYLLRLRNHPKMLLVGLHLQNIYRRNYERLSRYFKSTDWASFKIILDMIYSIENKQELYIRNRGSQNFLGNPNQFPNIVISSSVNNIWYFDRYETSEWFNIRNKHTGNLVSSQCLLVGGTPPTHSSLRSEHKSEYNKSEALWSLELIGDSSYWRIKSHQLGKYLVHPGYWVDAVIVGDSDPKAPFNQYPEHWEIGVA